MTGTGGGQFEVRGDNDWYRVRFEAGKTYTISESGPLFLLKLYLPNGVALDPPLVFGNQITFVAPVTGDYWVAATDFNGGAPAGYSISALEVVDANPASTATSLTLAVGQTVNITGSVAQDWHAVSLIAGQSYFAFGSGLTDRLYLADGAGQVLTVQNQQLHYTATTTGNFFVGILPGSSSYSLTLEAVADDHGQTAATAGALAVGGSTGGVWETGNDADWYAITLAAGSSYKLTVTGPGGLTAGTGVDVYDSAGVLVGSSTGSFIPAAAAFAPDITGTYYVSARVASEFYNPHGNWSYSLAADLLPGDLPDNALTTGTLAVGGTSTGNVEAPGDADWYAITLTAGQSYQFAMKGAAGTFSDDFSVALRDASGTELVRSSGIGSFPDGFKTFTAYTAPTSGIYYVEATAKYGSTYDITTASYADDFANNSLTTGALVVGGTANGTFETQGDRDWFAVTLTAGLSYSFVTNFGILTVRDAQGHALTQTVSGDAHFSPAASGTYFLEALGDSGSYTLGIAQVQDNAREDMLSTGVIRQTTFGTAANETFTSTVDHDSFAGQAGDDWFNAGEGYDVYGGGAGTDTVSFAGFGSGVTLSLLTPGLFEGATLRILISGMENIEGSAFNDTFTGNSANNVMLGLDGDDTLGGGNGDDTLNGGTGNDILDGGTGNDAMTGGTGDDYFVVDSASDTIVEGFGGGLDTVFTSISYTLSDDIERLGVNGFTTTYAINLAGNAWANEMWGNDGANILDGRTGADIMSGYGGNDIYVVDNAGDTIVEGFGGGLDTVFTSISYTLSDDIERLGVNGFTTTYAINLTGNVWANEMWGNDGANILDGRTGADIMSGYGGNDIYVVDNAGDTIVEGSGGGFDTVFTSISYTLSDDIERVGVNGAGTTFAIDLTGNARANEISGNAGANVIAGQGGSDVLIGNGGADTFAFTSSIYAGSIDQVLDFQVGVDKIGLDDGEFAGLSLGALAPGAFRVGAAAQDADDRIIYDQATGALSFDADGSGAGAAVQFAALSSGLGLTASDFLVI